MNTCRKMQRKLAAGAGEDDRAAARHLSRCPSCRAFAEELGRIREGAADARGDLAAAMAGIDWDAHAERIADAAFAPGLPAAAARPAAPARTLFGWGLRPALAGLLAGIVLGAGATAFLLRARPGLRAGGAKITASGDFIERAEYELARRDALDYLDRSRLLILDLVQAEPGRPFLLKPGAGPGPARDMIARKRLINTQLGSIRMAKAREICDQIEALFLELSAVSGELTEAEAARMRDYVEGKNLLLKIRLLTKELRESEV